MGNSTGRITKKIVCLGGGTGTVNLLKGLKKYHSDITTIVSMADTGGSAGRIRRLYDLPLGDLVTCMSALSEDSKNQIEKLLLYRFPGDRYGKDHHLGGHKAGNLIMAALTHVTGDLYEAIARFQSIFHIEGKFLPATQDHVNISAVTIDGQEIMGEEKIDLGQYHGKRVLEQVFIHPQNPKEGRDVVQAIEEADAIICGPGDLYTTLLPVLIVPAIAQAVKKSTARKLFIVNVANKPFETKGYRVSSFVKAVEKHLGDFPFDTLIVNNEFSTPIPPQYKYTYVQCDKNMLPKNIRILEQDLVNETFPLYHDSAKLAKAVAETV